MVTELTFTFQKIFLPLGIFRSLSQFFVIGVGAGSGLLIRSDEVLISVRAEPVYASATLQQAQGQRFHTSQGQINRSNQKELPRYSH